MENIGIEWQMTVVAKAAVVRRERERGGREIKRETKRDS